MGFAVPLKSWLESEQSSLGQLASDVLLSDDPFVGLNIKKEVVTTMFQELREGQRNHVHMLFALLTLALWNQRVRA